MQGESTGEKVAIPHLARGAGEWYFGGGTVTSVLGQKQGCSASFHPGLQGPHLQLGLLVSNRTKWPGYTRLGTFVLPTEKGFGA